MKILRCLVVAGLAVLPASAMAAPGIYGQSGVLFTPDATVLPKGCVDAGWHHFETDLTAGGSRPDVNIYSVNYGFNDRFEIGLGYADADAIGNQVQVNAKYALIPEQNRHFGLVIGMIDLTGAYRRTGYIYAGANIGGTVRHVPV